MLATTWAEARDYIADPNTERNRVEIRLKLEAGDVVLVGFSSSLQTGENQSKRGKSNDDKQIFHLNDSIVRIREDTCYVLQRQFQWLSA